MTFGAVTVALAPPPTDCVAVAVIITGVGWNGFFGIFSCSFAISPPRMGSYFDL